MKNKKKRLKLPQHTRVKVPFDRVGQFHFATRHALFSFLHNSSKKTKQKEKKKNLPPLDSAAQHTQKKQSRTAQSW